MPICTQACNIIGNSGTYLLILNNRNNLPAPKLGKSTTSGTCSVLPSAHNNIQYELKQFLDKNKEEYTF